jgi:hypothetical protein
LGLNFKRPHSATWKRLCRAAGAPSIAGAKPVIAKGSQLVGF